MRIVKILSLVFLFTILFFNAFAQRLIKNKFIDTIIVSKNDPVISSETVTFSFQGIDKSNKSKSFRFQTVLLPIEKKWQNYDLSTKTYSLPKGLATYIFKVRAINDKNRYDPTPAFFVFTNYISNFYKDIRINISNDGFSLVLENKSTSSINITGWHLVSSNINLYIPKMVKNLLPDYYNITPEDVVLEPGGKLIIKAVYNNAASLPLNINQNDIKLAPLNFNFLVNKCLGYLHPDYTNLYCDKFTATKDELLTLVQTGRISRQCALILENPDCRGRETIKKVLEINDYYCKTLVFDWYNYRSCYARNQDKTDFYLKDWHMFIDPRSPQEISARKPLKRLFQDRYEAILLYDSNNLLVDKYSIY